MESIKTKNWIVALAGVWVVIAPFLLGYRTTAGALWNDIIVGVAVVVFAIIAAVNENEGTIRWMDGITAVLGLWLVLSPFILGYSSIAAALWSDIIAGLVVLVLSLWNEIQLPQVASQSGS